MIPQDGDPSPDDWSARANEAARSVTALFGQRLFFLPGTHIGAIVRPSGRMKNLFRPWHYWWQAHYLDCLVDAGNRVMGENVVEPFSGDIQGKCNGSNGIGAGHKLSYTLRII